MRNFVFSALLLCGLCCASTAAAALTLQLRPQAEAAGPEIRLADIALILPEGNAAETIGQLVVGVSPEPGRIKEISRQAVQSALSTATARQAQGGVTINDLAWQGAGTCAVTRKALRLSREDLQQIVNAWLEENMARLSRGEARFVLFYAPESVVLPFGELRCQVTPSHPGIIGSSSLSVLFTVDGKAAGNCLLRGKMEIVAEVATAAMALRKGERITADKVLMRRMNIDGLDAPVTDARALEGMIAAKAVGVGKPIEAAAVAMPPVIREGEMVSIFASKGSLQISTKGIAKSEGRQGETIRIKNISSNKVIYGRVESPGTVSVEF